MTLTVCLQSWPQLTCVIWVSVLITAALIGLLASSNVQFLRVSVAFKTAAAGIHACQDMSLNLFVPLYVSSILTGCWMLSHGGP